MIESDITFIMSGLVRNSGQAHLLSPQEYRVLGSVPSHPGEDDLPSDLQSLSWLTSVDVPRLQQMTSERMDCGINSENVVLQQTGSAPGPMSHTQASQPSNMGGLNPISSLGTNISQYVVWGQPSPGLQPQQPAPLFPPPSCHTQQIFTITRSTQQCSPATLYNASYGTHTPYSQPRLAPLSAQELQAKHYPKPIYSYSCLIAMALKNSKTGSLPVSEIYRFMKEHFPYFKTAPDGWKNSVRHNLSLNKCFEKVENKIGGPSRKGCLWALNPAKIDKMEEEMQKGKRKDLAAIHRSMAKPEELDRLITDRPESCRKLSKPAEGKAFTRSHGAATPGHPSQPQPIATLPLQSVPLKHRCLIQAEAGLAPASPAPVQTPPLHGLHGICRSPIPQYLGSRGPDFLGFVSDLSEAEVDALDPSIMDLALQGNLWEGMKEESFSLETFAAFNSPLALSDCDFAPSGLPPASSTTGHSFADLQVTGLYTTYTTLDTIPPASYHLGAPGNKPIALL